MTSGGWRRLLGQRAEPTVIYECRRCGTTVDGDTTACPQCGADSIAKYELR